MLMVMIVDKFDSSLGAQGTVTLTIPSLAPNTTGVLTFKVRVNQNTPALA